MVTELELGTLPWSHGLQPRMSSPQPEEAEAGVGSHCHFSCSPAFPARGYALLGAPGMWRASALLAAQRA